TETGAPAPVEAIDGPAEETAPEAEEAVGDNGAADGEPGESTEEAERKPDGENGGETASEETPEKDGEDGQNADFGTFADIEESLPEDGSAEEDVGPDGETAGEKPASEKAGGVEFEDDGAEKDGKSFTRKPYHERYYLLFGGKSEPAFTDLDGTLEILKKLVGSDTALKQAREGKNFADMYENGCDPSSENGRYCAFCGKPLKAGDHERLSDGRERCMTCGKTAVKSLSEFESLYREVRENMEKFFDIKLTTRVKVCMVSARKLRKELDGGSFVPGQKLKLQGFARSANGKYSIYVENGAPRLLSVMTMAHELTHIWQYTNWDRRKMLLAYGKDGLLECAEGMAKWAEIQYTYLISESVTAKRNEILTELRDDEYGRGFVRYKQQYGMSEGSSLDIGDTPFEHKNKPLND
ncbi:MAG: hypothetical protein IJS65_00215, partial [Clostridia bacterium]|nr:hypothetical protein [Clostridia bacterium]